MNAAPQDDLPTDPTERAQFLHGVLEQWEQALKMLKEDVRNRMLAARLADNPQVRERLEAAQRGESDLPGVNGQEFYKDVMRQLVERGNR